VGGPSRLVELILHLLFDIAGSAADAFLYLAADIADGARYTVFVLGSPENAARPDAAFFVMPAT
jgi:hypothetical protein